MSYAPFSSTIRPFLTGSFFDEVLTTVENNRFLRAVQDSKEPINLDLRSSSDPAIQQKIVNYGSHSSFNIRNALNLNLSLNWFFLKYLSALQLLPTESTYNPVTDAPPSRKGKGRRYYYSPEVYIDHFGQIVTKATIPSKLLDKLQIDTASTPYTPIYQAFVALKDKQKKIETEVLQYEEEIYEDGQEAADKREQSRNAAPKPPHSPTAAGPESKKTEELEKEEDVMLDESQLRISTTTSHGTNTATLSYKKIGRILLRVLHYQYQLPQNRYHTAVNLWNELFALIYSYQDKIKVVYKRIMAFRALEAEKNSSYHRRLKDRLTRVYLNNDRYRRPRNTFTSPSMEHARTPQQELEIKNMKQLAKGIKEDKDVSTLPSARKSNSSLFESVPASSAGTTVPYESLPKAFTSVPMKEQAAIMACDPAIVFLAYLIADGVLHHIFNTVSGAVKAYRDLERARVEKVTQVALEQVPVPEEKERKGTISSTTSRLGALLSVSKQDPDEIQRSQNDTIWMRRKSLIIRVQPFEGFYTGQNQSPHLATAAQQPLGTLAESDDEEASQPQPKKENPYNIFNGLEYISAEGPPHNDTLSLIYSPIYFAPDLFVSLFRSTILYPLLEPLLIKPATRDLEQSKLSSPTSASASSASAATTTTATAAASSPTASTNQQSNPNSPPSTQNSSATTTAASAAATGSSTTDAAGTEMASTETQLDSKARKALLIKNAVGTTFVESQFFVVWARIQEYLESAWNLDHNFNQFRILGRGAFGTVTGVQHTKLQSVYAVKEISKKMVKHNGKGYHFMVKNERRMLKAVHSPFVLRLWASLGDAEKLYLFTDICLGGDLSHHLKQQQARRFHYARARFYAAQIVLGLEHMHKRNIVYRDLKPSNILLDSEGNAKISDLGLSLKLPKEGILRHVAGTAGYWAPEIVSKLGTTVTSDYWSLGVMLYEMLCGHRPKLRTDIYAKRGKELAKDKTRGRTPRAKDIDQLSQGSLSRSRANSHQRSSKLGDDRDSGSELRSSFGGSGNSPSKPQQEGPNTEITESALYLKSDQRASKSFAEYPELLRQFNKGAKDLNLLPTEKIQFNNIAFFAPNGSILNPFQQPVYTPHRFMLLPSVLSSSGPNIPRRQGPIITGGGAATAVIAPINVFDEPLPTPTQSQTQTQTKTPPDSPRRSSPSDATEELSSTKRLIAGGLEPLEMNASPKQKTGVKKAPLPKLARGESQSGNGQQSNDNSRVSMNLSRQPSAHNSTNHTTGQSPMAGVSGDEPGQGGEEQPKHEEVGSIQSQVLELIKDDADDGDDDDEDNSKAEDYDESAPNSRNDTPVSPDLAALKPVLANIPPDLMAKCQIKCALYDKTNKHQLLAPGLGSLAQHNPDRFVIGMSPEGVPVRQFRVTATTEDNIIPGIDIQRAVELSNNPSRWSPFDQSSKTETVSRQENSLLDVDIDYNIDAAFLTTDAVDLFIRLFDPDPYSRLGARGIDEIKNHPFFTNPIQGFGAIDWNLLSQQLIVPPYKPESNTVHAKSMDELANSPQEAKYKGTKLTAEDEQQYASWYYTDAEHREQELVRILNNNVDLQGLLWGSADRRDREKSNNSKACCDIM